MRRLELLLHLDETRTPEIHQESCCISELSIDEWETLDTLFNVLHSVTECERQTLFYIAGYIHKKENMTEHVTDLNIIGDDSEFLSLVSRGRLAFPSEELFNFSLLSYIFFQKNLNVGANNVSLEFSL